MKADQMKTEVAVMVVILRLQGLGYSETCASKSYRW
jgi:hypothetical protein